MVDDDVWFRPPEPLGLPFAAMALACGVFVSDFMRTARYAAAGLCLNFVHDVLPRRSLDLEFCLLVGVVYAFAFGLAGRWVAKQLVVGAAPTRTMLWAMFVAGQCAACVLGLVSFGQLMGFGMIAGVVTSLVCMPFALLLAHNASWAWRARVGSVLHNAHRSARWIDVATGVTVLLALYANPIFGSGYQAGRWRPGLAMAFVAVATAVAIVWSVRSMVSLFRLGRVRRRFAGAVAASGVCENEDGAPVFDMGIGDDRAHDRTAAASAYRHQDKIDAVCVGDIARAWRVIGRSVGRALGVVALGLFVVFTELQVKLTFVGSCS